MRLLFCLLIACVLMTCSAGALRSEEPLKLPPVLLTVTESAEVSAGRAGILEKILVREGQIVQAKQVIAELNSAKAAVTLEEAQLKLRMSKQAAEDDIEIRYARKKNERARSEMRRSEAVNEDLPGTISQRELEILELALEQSALEIERAEKDHLLLQMKLQQDQAAVRKARLELEEHSFLAPISGMVVSVAKQSGEWIEPGDRIVKIVRIDRIRAEGFLPAERASLNLMDQPVELTVQVSPNSKVRAEGKITFVSPEVNPVNGLVRVWSEFDCGETPLRPGLRGTVQIKADHGHKQAALKR